MINGFKFDIISHRPNENLVILIRFVFVRHNENFGTTKKFCVYSNKILYFAELKTLQR